ncbi:MAG TPA: AAA family ATPase [Gaiellaceae bacterium]|nr:AAA family ATPase [Gaiellaceae bacterium]
MASLDTAGVLSSSRESVALASQLRRLARVATVVAILTGPAVFVWLHHVDHLSTGKALLATAAIVIGFRGVVDLLTRRLIPWPSLFGTEDSRLREEDVVNRRRAWTWRFFYRVALVVGGIVTLVFAVQLGKGESVTWWGTAGAMAGGFAHKFAHPGGYLPLILIFFIYFIFNFLILLGPMLMLGISQIRGYEPGDAEWGVRLEDVRGQAEAKEEVRRIVTLWQSGEAFERAGGKRERGLLFLGAPGTGKTMLAKAIATGFNSPFVSIPGSGFAQTFIGIDAIIVRYLARKAKRLARKWGGQCIVFIDEIDAVGLRRQALAGGEHHKLPGPERPYHGSMGAVTASGDVIVEDRAWREWLFRGRAPEPRSPYPLWTQKLGNLVNQGVFPGMFGGGGMGQLALNQLLVTMDGIDNPPFLRRILTNRVNSFLDAVYVVPRRIGGVSLRLPPPRPLGAQIYFIGATNVPMEVLDPALTRPGRMGRHVWFRTPTKDDRKDIFDLYLAKVSHDPGLDTPQRRDEIARITNGFSPAMIEQICSMALTNAHHEGKLAFEWHHLVDAMTVVESGTAVGIRYVEHETRAVAIHEAGHAAAAHVYRPDLESSRISIKMRGGSLGHHQAYQKEERFSQWQSEHFGALVHILGAMAAETVFYGENSNGVGGDLQSVTWLAGTMVGAAGMAPRPIPVNGSTFEGVTGERAQKRIEKRIEQIGNRLLNRSTNPFEALNDRAKRPLVAQFVGEAFVTAYNFVRENKDGVERVANAVVEKQEIYGDELVQLLDAQNLRKPQLDWAKEETWPPM